MGTRTNVNKLDASNPETTVIAKGLFSGAAPLKSRQSGKAPHIVVADVISIGFNLIEQP